MKLVSFSAADGKVRPGALLEKENLVVDLSAAHADALAVIAAGITKVDKISDLPGYRLSGVKLHAPLPNPPRIFAIGLNYRDHARESNMALPKYPVVFFKLSPSIIGPGETVILPKISTQPDYEAEFAFVIGQGGYRIPAADWKQHVYGYTIINDVSARDFQLSTSQWTLGKSFPTFCPMGPAIVTVDEIADPHELGISLSIDGEILQNSNTRELIFPIAELVEYISSITPLLTGDIVATGTPPGVGLGRTPQRWIQPGETMTVTIDGLGSLTNPVAAE